MKKTNFQSHTSLFVNRISCFISLVIIILLVSCSDKKDPIGKWDDNIKLSTKYAEFSVRTDSITINTQGDWWWVNGISVNDSIYNFYGREDIDLESDSYTIKEDFFVVERRNKNTLFIRMEENYTGKDRLMTITLEAGDYFDYVNIKQLAK